MATLLEVKNLKTYFYSREGIVRAVNDVSFDVKERETLGIVGESGCGKSVTALSIMRLVRQPPGKIMGGEVLLRGKNLLTCGDGEMRQIRGHRIGLVFQDPMTSLNPVLTISRQLTESLELHLKLDKQAAKKRAVALLDTVGIPSAARRIDDYPHQFSGGMRQRVMIAMAIACNPELIIADEPTTALDVTIQAQILDLLRQIRDDLGSAIILITHDLGVVAGMCDRVIVMYAGRVVEMAPVDEIYECPAHPYTIALLKSVPSLDDAHRSRLKAISGLPPDLVKLPPGCSFRPRCDSFGSYCRDERPQLVAVGPDHYVACWMSEDGNNGES